MFGQDRTTPSGAANEVGPHPHLDAHEHRGLPVPRVAVVEECHVPGGGHDGQEATQGASHLREDHLGGVGGVRV